VGARDGNKRCHWCFCFEEWNVRFYFRIVFLSLLALQNLSPANSQQTKQNHAATWAAMFQSQVGRCWKKYIGSGTKIQTANIAFEIKLKRNGMLEGPPVPEEPAASPDLRIYQDNAVRAITECQPYQLPAEYYEEWKYFAPVFVATSFAGS
jgi:hypothetical protein